MQVTMQTSKISSLRKDNFKNTPSISLLAMQCSLREIHFDPDESNRPEIENDKSVRQRSPLDFMLHSSAPMSPCQVNMISPPISPENNKSQVSTGTIRFKDGRIFRGKHIHGNIISGVMSYPDGSVYEGGWVDGKRHGQGICTFADGSHYEGDFAEGEFHGHGQLVWSDGGFYLGDWCRGEIDGMGMEVRADGTLRHNGAWRQGIPLRNHSHPAGSRKVSRAKLVVSRYHLQWPDEISSKLSHGPCGGGNSNE